MTLKRILAWGLAPSVLFGAVAGVLFWGGLNTAMEATNTQEFCISCHEMRDNVYKEYIQSPHYRNASGVRASCPDCHVPRDWTHKVVRKVQATNELWAKITGRIDTPEKFEARRLDLARHEWRRMKETDSRECRNCHSFEAMDFHKQDPKAAEAMRLAQVKGSTCIDCHKGVAHKTPDLTARFRAQARTIADRAKAEQAKAGDLLVSIRSAPFFKTPAGAQETPAGALSPLTRVSALATEGDWIEVEIRGWRREGFQDRLYAHVGERTPAAALAAQGLAALVATGSALDRETDETWTRSKLTGWMRRADLSRDLGALQSYGAELYESMCSYCHVLHRPDAFTANEWIGKSNAMKRLVPLDSEEFAFLQKYLQTLASGKGGGS